jgi:hypothetical protein
MLQRILCPSLTEERVGFGLRITLRRPKSWHDIGNLPQTQRAADLLAARGVIEIREPQGVVDLWVPAVLAIITTLLTNWIIYLLTAHEAR